MTATQHSKTTCCRGVACVVERYTRLSGGARAAEERCNAPFFTASDGMDHQLGDHGDIDKLVDFLPWDAKLKAELLKEQQASTRFFLNFITRRAFLASWS